MSTFHFRHRKYKKKALCDIYIYISHDEQKCGNTKEGNPEIRIRLDKFGQSLLFMKPTNEHSWHSRFIVIEITYRGIYSIVIFACILGLLSRIYKTRQKWIFHREKICSFFAHTHTHTHTHIYIYIYIYIYICKETAHFLTVENSFHTRAHTHTHTHTLYTYMCMCVCIYIYIVYTHTHCVCVYI